MDTLPFFWAHPCHQDPGIVYAGTLGDGVIRSTDSGLTWSQVNDGLDVQSRTISNVAHYAIKIHRLVLGKDNRTLFALYDSYASGPYHTDSNDPNGYGKQTTETRLAKVFRLDIGRNTTTWQEVPRPNPMTIGVINDMDMTASSILYMAPRPRFTDAKVDFPSALVPDARVSGMVNGGAFVSEDNGIDYRQIFDPRIPVTALFTDPRDENII